jgi:hypothetical protein
MVMSFVKFEPLVAASWSDEEFKAKVVRSYNRCAAEHKEYKRALEFIAERGEGLEQLVARDALKRAKGHDA